MSYKNLTIGCKNFTNPLHFLYSNYTYKLIITKLNGAVAPKLYGKFSHIFIYIKGTCARVKISKINAVTGLVLQLIGKRSVKNKKIFL